MDKRFTIGWKFVVSVLGAYFLLGILSTGGVIPPASVLVLALVIWFSVYKLRHSSLGNRGIVTQTRADLEAIKEKLAQQEARRLATLEHEEQARLEREWRRAERERRRASGPTRDPAVSEYAKLIESRVRERERSGQESERQ